MKDAPESTLDAISHSPDGPIRVLCPTLILAFTPGRTDVELWRLDYRTVFLGRHAKGFPGGPLEDPQMSRQHAEIASVRGRWVLRELGSRNGTWLNRERLSKERALSSGDVIRLGSTLVVYADIGHDAEPDARSLPALVGHGEGIIAVRRSIRTVAGQRRAVLITGETGTGKELVAEAVHKQSGRRGRLLAVNCGAFTEDILTSELFGHVRGAFTGAVQDRPGLFRAADKGTLFLDELGEIPPSLQAKLLRVLEGGRVRPVGSTDDVPVDVAIVSATNRDLAAEMQAGRFRADLYARLAQWMIHLPPLRERREDIPALVHHLLGRCSASGRGITPRLGEALLFHPWPLNVRGLLNVVSIAALASPEGKPLDLHAEVSGAMDAARAVAPAPAGLAKKTIPTAEQLEAVLVQFEGRVADAARHLGCTRQQLYRWLDRCDLSPDRYRKQDTGDSRERKA